MGNPVVLDAGPLAALINRDDQFHEWAVARLKETRGELLTCDAVISECYFILRQNPWGIIALLSYLEEGVVRLDFDLNGNLSAVCTLMRKYRDVPMSLADACLVRMSEIHDRARVFTLDSDFRVYRRHGRQSIPLIYPAP